MTVLDVMPNTFVDTYQCAEGPHCLQLQGKTSYTLKMNTVRCSKILVPMHQTALHDMLQAHNLSIHRSDNLKS